MTMPQLAFFASLLLCLVVFTVFGPISVLSQQLTAPPLVTRTNDPQYAILFNNPDVLSTTQASFIDQTPIRLGDTGQLTAELEFLPRGYEGCVWSFGTPGTDSYLSLQITQNGRLRLRNGVLGSANSELVTPNPVITTLNAWHSISVTIENEGGVNSNGQATYAFAQIFVNGTLVHSGQLRPLVNAVRGGFVGNCQYVRRLDLASQQPLGLYGAIDNYRLWGVVRTQAQIQEFNNMLSRQVAIYDTEGLYFHAYFTEGFGTVMNVRPGPLLSSYFVLTLHNAVWIVKNSQNQWRQCTSTYDPHVWVGIPGGSNNRYDPMDFGYFVLTTCGPDMQVNVYHDYWSGNSGATSNGGVSIRIRNNVWYLYQNANLKTRVLGSPFVTVAAPASGTTEDGARWSWTTDGVFNLEHSIFGTIKVVRLSWNPRFYNIYVTHTQGCESFGIKGICNNELIQISYEQFVFDDLTTPPPPRPVPPPNNDPCDNLPTSIRNAFLQEATAACSRVIDQNRFPEAFRNCMYDVCAAGDTGVTINIDDSGECRLQEILAAAQNASEFVTPSCMNRTFCPNQCGGHGNCDLTTGKCQCDNGWVGIDCSRPYQFRCFHLNYTGLVYPIWLNPYEQRSGSLGVINSQDVFRVWNKWHIDDSILIYFVKIDAGLNTATYNLFISNDNSNSDGGSYTMTITGIDSRYSSYQVLGDSGSGSVTITPGPTTVINFSWKEYQYNGIAFLNLQVTNSFTFSITNANGISQVVIGSGSYLTELDVLKIPSSMWSNFQLTTDLCTDDCAAYTDCESCAADDRCGWCRDRGECLMGLPSGPVSTPCRNWKYSTDLNQARRLTISFGYPVNPDEVVAYLPVTATQDLLVDFFVSMGNRFNVYWDVALLLPVSSLTNNDDKENYLSELSKLPNVLRLFPSLGFALGTYNDLTTNPFTLSTPLVDATYVTGDHLRRWAQSFQFRNANNRAATTALASLIAPSAPLNFRQNTRRMIAIYVDHSPVWSNNDPNFPDPARVREFLLQHTVIPVFLATRSVSASWRQVVTDLGFGLVVEIADDASNLAFVFGRALLLATGQVSIVVDGTQRGHVNFNSFNVETSSILGLSDNMRAHFAIPFKANAADVETTRFIVPGFGTAKVENVLSDVPQTTLQRIRMLEDNFDQNYKFNGTVFRLTGIGANGQDPVLAQIISPPPPSFGGLYQFDPSGPNPSKYIAPGTTPYVTDQLGRVIYLAPPDASSIGDAPYTSFVYRVRDACGYSANQTVEIYVIGVNDRPWTQMSNPSGNEDTPIVIQFNYFDRENDPADAYVDVPPYEVDENGNRRPVGTLYQYSDQVARGDLTNAVQISAGQRVTDPQRRVVYIPPPNANSAGLPPSLYVFPYLVYHVKETACCSDNSCDRNTCSLLSSWPETIRIFINPVNDPPEVWQDEWTQRFNFTVPPCYSTCTFREDNGARYPQPTPDAYIWLGGDDIEESDLTAIITALDVPSTARLLTLDGKNVTIGTSIPGLRHGTLNPALRFVPGLDEYDDPNKGYYAKITYKVNDGELDSLTTKTITIHVAPVNDIPRPIIESEFTFTENGDNGAVGTIHVITPEETPVVFNLRGYDPDGDAFDLIMRWCDPDGGDLYLNTTSGLQWLNCSRINKTPQNLGEGTIWTFTYVPPPDTWGDSLQLLQYVFDDRHGDLLIPDDVWHTVIDVLPINDPPRFSLDGGEPSQRIEVNTSLPTGSVLVYNLSVSDVDVEFGTMNLTVIVECLAENGTALPDSECSPALSVNNDIVRNLPDVQSNEISPHRLSFSARIIQINSLLTAFTLSSQSDAKVRMTITVNDNGNTGVCPPVSGQPVQRYCPLQSEFVANIVIAPAVPLSTIIIAATAGAVAAAGLGVAAALWSKFSGRASQPDYQPWNFDNLDNVVNNPLFESKTQEVVNPLHNGK